MSDTPICPNCNIPYAALSKEDKRQLALAKQYHLVCPRCFAALGEGNSKPESLFDQLNLERSHYLGIIQTLRSIETARTLLEKYEVLRTIFAPDSKVRYAWANVAPELLRELWAVMAKIGGTVPLRPGPLNGPRRVSEPFIQDVLRALDDVVRWCEQKLSTSGNPAGTNGYADGPTREGFFFQDGVPYNFARLQWRLLKTLYGKGSVAFEAIGQELWGHSEWKDERLRKLVNDTNAKLLEHGLRFEIISPMAGHYLLQELPPVTPKVT
jgi:hypothetical protein